MRRTLSKISQGAKQDNGAWGQCDVYCFSACLVFQRDNQKIVDVFRKFSESIACDSGGGGKSRLVNNTCPWNNVQPNFVFHMRAHTVSTATKYTYVYSTPVWHKIWHNKPSMEGKFIRGRPHPLVRNWISSLM